MRASDTDEIMLELAPELCSLFEAERFTIYALEEGGASIVTRVKTGLSGGAEHPPRRSARTASPALSRSAANWSISATYDDEEPAPHLAAPRAAPRGRRQHRLPLAPDAGRAHPRSRHRQPARGRALINTLNREPFSKMTEEGLMGLAQTLGVAFLRHNRQAGRLRSRFRGAGGRWPHHRRGVRRRHPRGARSGAGTENLLIEQLGLSHAELGAAASRYFGVPYQPFVANHVKLMDLLRNIKREFVERSLWLPWEENPRAW